MHTTKGTRTIDVATIQDVADAVRIRREELRLRYSDVGAIAGVSRHLAAALEKGQANDQVEKALHILAALQIQVILKIKPPKHVAPPPPPERPARTRTVPAVEIERMFDEPGCITCLECGASVRDLSRHLSSMHQVSIPAYRQRWGIDQSVGLRPRRETVA